MFLNQLPESSSAPRKRLLSPKLLLAITLALASCDKQPTAPSELAPVKASTGMMDEKNFIEPTPEERQKLAQRVIAETLGATKTDFYDRGFPRDAEHPSAWHVVELATGFGQPRGTHIVTVKKEGDKTFVNDMADWNNDGIPDEVSMSVSSPTPGSNGKLMHSDTSYVVDEAAQKNYFLALRQALAVLEAEKEAKKKGK